jgi:hypothetical protein
MISRNVARQPLLRPSLANRRFGDPALYIETLFEKRAILSADLALAMGLELVPTDWSSRSCSGASTS